VSLNFPKKRLKTRSAAITPFHDKIGSPPFSSTVSFQQNRHPTGMLHSGLCRSIALIAADRPSHFSGGRPAETRRRLSGRAPDLL